MRTPSLACRFWGDFVAALGILLLVALPGSHVEADDSNDGITFFEDRIRPVLVSHCYECHSAEADEVQGGLLLDTRAGIRDGGDSGPSIVPHEEASSSLLEAIRYEGLEMPPAGKLPDDVIADFEKWVRLGAPDPRDGSSNVTSPEPDYEQARQFWAFRPIRQSELPAVRNRMWPRTSVDFYVLEKLESSQLGPAPAAERAVLARRVYFDVLGLPPTPAQIDDFVNDPARDAYERLVDQLLTSPHYGERWGQHWLDVVRFAETEGFEYDRGMPGAWRYRDYVIDSLRADKPFDAFVREQLAGDEIDADSPPLRVAAGFHRFGPVRRNAGNQEVAASRNEILTERTDIIGSAFLALTVGCARCHDHKFDAISQKDYYRLQAFLAATCEDNVVLASEQEQQQWAKKKDRIERKIARLKQELETQTGSAEEQTRTRITSLEAQLPAPLPTICSIRNDLHQLTPIHVLRRGEWEKKGERVGMRALAVLVPDDETALAPQTPAPRTRLAEWLTHADHPLTARVIANRVWQRHFGRGIVATANDFGSNGARPSHPALLDHLARTLIDKGWRLKPLHRLILLSSTYRQSSRSLEARGREIDPDNKLLWQFRRRRLSAEEIRDAMLAVSGRLNRSLGGRSVMVPVDQELIDQLYKPTQWQVTRQAAEHARRSIYLVAKRNLKLPFMEVFDQPASLTSCPRREQSTHAPQALELLNGRLSNQLASAFAYRLRSEVGDDLVAQVRYAFRLAVGRPPKPREFQLALHYLHDGSLREFALAIFNLNAFLYIQ